jgi:chemotaxis protein MotB
MLEDIKQAMKKQGVKVIVDPENGVLRLPEELLFERGEFELTEKGHVALQQLGEVLAQTLPCYADDPTRQGVACPKTNGGRLEAVFIEGHTDDRQIAGRMKNCISSNWELSTARAIATFKALVQQAKSLALIDNDSHLRLLGVSGYAENRPVSPEDTEEARASNRRIDLRFLMATPNTEELARIRQNVETGIVHP